MEKSTTIKQKKKWEKAINEMEKDWVELHLKLESFFEKHKCVISGLTIDKISSRFTISPNVFGVGIYHSYLEHYKKVKELKNIENSSV